ncbi:transposase [Ichthyobacterium seriolicida]|uniref:Transposase n=1 Tax=Ichthyobacterium seriolicida TaxID=242600 RepID=A0A1J1E5E4_9FLAO|nr:transposase [Ichthyobacterium seriolicida]
MKNTLIPMIDKLLLRKRSIIETINDQLKNICQIEHSRHRSFANFLTNISELIALTAFRLKNPLSNTQSLVMPVLIQFINQTQIIK